MFVLKLFNSFKSSIEEKRLKKKENEDNESYLSRVKATNITDVNGVHSKDGLKNKDFQTIKKG